MSKSKPTGIGERAIDGKAVARFEAAAGKLGQLTARQQKAAALILTGCAIGEVAQRVSVSRRTIYNWTHHHRQFVEALQSWQRDMIRSARSRLLGLSGTGVKAIGLAMDRGDAKVALAMFKGLGVLDERRGKEEMDEEPVVIRHRPIGGTSVDSG